ncbi:MAG TPA: xylulokinase [Jiangellaceae bacterium]|nr:xylulokinase [Jiangellaceae bacterium]
MTLVAGIDSSTQSCKIVLCDANTGVVVDEGRATHPEDTEVHPHHWWDALMQADTGLLARADAVAVAGQQHGMVTLDADDEVVRPALLWNDTRSAGAAAELVRELGGPQAWAEAVGVVPVASFTVTKLRWLARHEAETARRVRRVLLPHDWLTWQLRDRPADITTDRGDASGTGYWSARTDEYRPDLLELALGSTPQVPRVAGPAEIVGHTPNGAAVAPGTGDNMGAALGLGVQPGDVIVSLGTSGTVFTPADTTTSDATGIIAGFADASGRYLPLVCTLNAARVLSATASMLGTDVAGLDRLALHGSIGAEGLTLLPYLDGERTPDLPEATGTLLGLTRASLTPEAVARAAVEGMLCGLAAGITALEAAGVEVRRVVLVGGAARSQAVQHVAASLFGVPVLVPPPGEYVARGAAAQAAWALAGEANPPRWELTSEVMVEPDSAAVEAYRDVRSRYEERREQVHGN